MTDDFSDRSTGRRRDPTRAGEVTDNLAPLKALGISGWTEGGGCHGLLKLTVH